MRVRIREWLAGLVAIGRSYSEIARLTPIGGGRLLATLVALSLATGVLPVAFILATSAMIGKVPAAVAGGVGSPAWNDLVLMFVVAAVAFVVQQILAPLQLSLGELMARRVDGAVFGRLVDAALSSPGIGPLEDQELLDRLADALRPLEQGFFTAGAACAGLIALIARYTQLVGCALIVAIAFSPLAAVAIVVATMAFRTGQRGGLRQYSRLFPTLARTMRRSDYFRRLSMMPPAAKEIRVFGLSDWLSDRYREAYLDWVMPMWAERRRIYFLPFLRLTIVGLVLTAVTLVAIGRAAAAGTLSLTELALLLQASLAALRLGDFYPEADVQTQYGMNSYDALTAFERGAAARSGPATTHGPVQDPAGRPAAGIHFDRVTFRYPDSHRPVLDGLDLVLPAGRCTAIVGLNGAGKTTLVKLLARLYEPTEGAVRVDGIDVRAFDVNAWRHCIGVIFQDYNRYELSAADNIGLGAVELLGERDRIRDAARRAGALAALERLPRGLDTPLSRQYAGGTDLSGGQWQRVAIARALFALEGGAAVLVLDEPTAALDVRAEAAFFDRFVDLTRGVTSILISHRFSSVRHADRIVVLEGGRVVEEGSHEELLELDGRYAALFRLQAERFAEEEEDLEQVSAQDLAETPEPTAEPVAPASSESPGLAGSLGGTAGPEAVPAGPAAVPAEPEAVR